MININKERILIISHGHPDISKGGAEVAAYNLFKEYKNIMPGDVLFIAREGKAGSETFHYSQKRNDEILFYLNVNDYFTHSQPQKEVLWREFKNLVEKFKPTIVHFHHYIHMGLEMIRVVKNLSSKPKIFLTLHEYAAICNNNGQMIKTGENKQLCYSSSPLECHQCFKSIPAGEFLLREHFIKSFFEIVDGFISPSIFLKERYVRWGIPAEKVKVIENGHIKVSEQEIVHRDLTESNYKIRFGYFGQLNPYKGIDVLLDAFQQLPNSIKKQLQLNIYGANLHIQSSDFQNKISEQLNKLGDVVINHGSYDSNELTTLMNHIDYVLVPSIWWENSPMVIQEAFMHKRPVICSNIGGMAEKVKDLQNGLHFVARSSTSLAEKIKYVCDKRDIYKVLVKNIEEPLTTTKCAINHLELYGINNDVTEASSMASIVEI